MATFAFRHAKHGGLAYFILLHTAEPPEPAVWAAYMDVLRRTIPLYGDAMVVLVGTDGGGPDAAQRREVAEVTATTQGTAHVFTESVVARGIVTALRWLRRSATEVHAPRQFAAVCRSLGLPPAVALDAFDEAQRDLPTVAVLDKLRRSRPSAPFRGSIWPPDSTPTNPRGTP